VRGRPLTERHRPCLRYFWQYDPVRRWQELRPIYPTWEATGRTRERQVGRYFREQAEARCGKCGKLWWSSHPHVVSAAKRLQERGGS
jgi:hypothetical protein